VPETVDLLIKFGADINVRNSLGDTLLHKSASDDEYLEVTKYLISKGLDINACGGFGDTPLIRAALQGCENTAKFLVKQGASLASKDSKGRTALGMAQQCEHHELAGWLETQNKHIP